MNGFMLMSFHVLPRYVVNVARATLGYVVRKSHFDDFGGVYRFALALG
jgi:hypothetical protein